MIGKTSSGKGFGGLLRYLLHGREGTEENRAAWVGFRNLLSDRVEVAAVEMRALAERAPRVEEPVYHLSLSASPEDRLSREDWERIAERVLRDLGLERHPVVLVAHRDRDHDHVHLVINRVEPRTLRAWDRWKDQVRIERSLRKVEREMGLREVPGRHFQLPGQVRPERSAGLSYGESREAERTGRKPFAERVREAARPVFREARSWAELEHGLREEGLRLEARGRGLVVTDGRRMVKASRIDREGSRGRLEERFGKGFREWREEVRELRERVEELSRLREEERRLQGLRVQVTRKEQRTHEVLTRAAWVEREAEVLHRRLSYLLSQAYRPGSVEKAEERLRAIAEREGHAAAARVLRERPAELGALRGIGAGRVGNETRKEAREWAQLAAGQVEGLGRIRGELTAGAARRAAATATLARLGPRVEAIARRMEQATAGRSTAGLEREVGRLGLRMGLAAVRLVLPEPASRVVATAARVLGAARELGRDLERSLGR